MRYSLMIPALLALSCASAAAGETQSFGYDAVGRLIGSCQRTPGNAQRTEYALDAADNRNVFLSFPTITVIPAGNAIASPDGRFQLAMQTDGNLVIYQGSTPIWASNTSGSGSDDVAVMQEDGNLVIYASGFRPIWYTSTISDCAKLALQNDGNLVIYRLDNTPIWDTHTGGH